MFLPPIFKTFWNDFLAQPDASEASRVATGPLAHLPLAERFYEACRFGYTVENADLTAGLILAGEKTATSSLLAEFELTGKPLPKPGALSIVVDGHDQAVAVIETLEVRITPFIDVGEQFVHDYGEGDRTLAFWQTSMWAFYFEECERLGTVAAEDMSLVCEYFKVLYAPGGPGNKARH